MAVMNIKWGFHMFIKILLAVLAILVLGTVVIIYPCIKVASAADDITNAYENKDKMQHKYPIFYIYIDVDRYFITFRKLDNYKLIAIAKSYEEAEEYIENLRRMKEK